MGVSGLIQCRTDAHVRSARIWETRRGGPDTALSVWVAMQQEVTEDSPPFKPSCSCVTQTSKAMSGPPRHFNPCCSTIVTIA